MQEIKFSSHKQYLFGRLFFRNAKKTDSNYTTLQVFLHCHKRKNSQTLKSSSCIKPFIQYVSYRYNLLRWLFFIPFGNWKSSFCKRVLLLWDSFSRFIVAFLEISVLKEVSILHYLHNIRAVVIPKFQNKAVVFFNWQTFVIDILLLVLFCNRYTLFFIDELSLKNSKPLWKHVFYIIKF